MFLDDDSVFDVALTSDVIDETAKELTSQERSTLVTTEKTIETGLDKAFELGAAFLTICESRLYREQYDTFEEYLAQRWDLSRGYAYGLMSASTVHSTLSRSRKHAVLPQNEFQARPLAKLTPEHQQIAWDRAVEAANTTNTPITHKLIKRVVDDLVDTAKLAVATITDRSGTEDVAASQYLLGDPLELLLEISEQSVDLLLISDLPGSTLASSTTSFTDLLAAAAPAMKLNHQVMVFSTFHDSRSLIGAAEALGYESGVAIYWVTNSNRAPVRWSAKQVTQVVLHFRKGSAQLAEQITNVIACESELFKKHPSQKPAALIQRLIEAATTTGMVVIDPTAGAATANIACRQLDRRCIGIERKADLHAAGVDRMRELSGLSEN